MSDNEPRLRFRPGSWSGFTPTNLAGFSDLRPPVVVRELIQNSLDAAVEANEHTAIVHFRLDTINTDEIPGYADYCLALEKSEKSQTSHSKGNKLPDHALEVVHKITDCLTQQTCEILSVLDNGIGLDDSKMTALLSDGSSEKSGQSAGSYGNGHMVSIPASDLRYILYGGVTKERVRIGSGHAVLASQDTDGDHPNGPDGFLVHDFRGGKDGSLFEYASAETIPALIQDALATIEAQWGHGAAVLIPGFNRFHEPDTPLWDMISRAAACNFFSAIHDGRLVIELSESVNSETTHHLLDKGSLPTVLDSYRSNRRSQSFLSGEKAHGAWETICRGDHHVVETSLGAVGMRLRYPSPKNMTRVDLCRNGMWIIDNRNQQKYIPGFYNVFNDYQTFEAVLLLDANAGKELHRLIRKAEGPLHDNLSLKLLRPEESKKLARALKEIREFIKTKIPRIEAKEYSPDDALVVDSEGQDGPGTGVKQMAFSGAAVEVGARNRRREIPGLDPDPNPVPNPPRPTPPHPNPNPNPVPAPFEPSRTPLRFTALAVPTGVRSCRIRLTCPTDCEDADLSLKVDENQDVTCDRLWSEESVTLKTVRKSGTLIKLDSKARTVRLGKLKGATNYDLEVTYEMPDFVTDGGDGNAVLRLELASRSKPRAVTST